MCMCECACVSVHVCMRVSVHVCMRVCVCCRKPAHLHHVLAAKAILHGTV